MQCLMLGLVKPSHKAEMKGNLWMKKTIIVFRDVTMLLTAAGHIQHTAVHYNNIFLIFPII
jgi:hypothetical protein